MSESGRPQVAIGIDVGGTKIAGGLVDLSGGGILARRTLATAAERGPEAVLDEALGLARSLIETAGERGLEVLGIGCGVPELVDLDGNVKSSYNFSWPGVAVQARFAELAPAVVESDVRAAARAEAAFGAARALDHAVYVTIGTGVSYCLIIEGEPYAGANGYAIHFAQSPLTARCDSCGAVSRPVVEEIASGPGLAARFAARGGRAQSGEEVVGRGGRGQPARGQRRQRGRRSPGRVDRSRRQHARSRGRDRRRRSGIGGRALSRAPCRRDARPHLGGQPSRSAHSQRRTRRRRGRDRRRPDDRAEDARLS